MPPCPEGLHPKAAPIWEGFWLSDAGAATRTDAYRPALEHWIFCVSERFIVAEKIAANPTGQGSVGQDAPSPLLSYLKELERKIEKYEEHFGMTPLAAQRLNVAKVQVAASVYDLNRKLREGREAPAKRTSRKVIDLGELG